MGWGIAGLLALGPWVVTAANVGGVLTVGGCPETAPWGEIATVRVFALGGAAVAFAPRQFVGQVRRRSPSGRSVAIVAVAAICVTGGFTALFVISRPKDDNISRPLMSAKYMSWC